MSGSPSMSSSQNSSEDASIQLAQRDDASERGNAQPALPRHDVARRDNRQVANRDAAARRNNRRQAVPHAEPREDPVIPLRGEDFKNEPPEIPHLPPVLSFHDNRTPRQIRKNPFLNDEEHDLLDALLTSQGPELQALLGHRSKEYVLNRCRKMKNVIRGEMRKWFTHTDCQRRILKIYAPIIISPACLLQGYRDKCDDLIENRPQRSELSDIYVRRLGFQVPYLSPVS